MQEWKNLGYILVEDGILTPKTVARVINMSKQHNKRFGWMLEKLGLVTSDELAAAIAKQYDLKTVTHLTNYTYDQKMLQLISPDVAIQNLIFPLKLEGNHLLLAVADPTETRITENMAANNDLKVTRCVATRDDIYAAICKYYLGKEVHEPIQETVLVVEDELTSQESVKVQLSKARYNVLVANNGMEGFNMIITEKPHIIITDKVMPKVDGFTLLKSIKAVPEIQFVPVILMSDKLSPEEEMKVFDLGFYDYIPKPVNSITLLSRVKRALKFNGHHHNLF